MSNKVKTDLGKVQKTLLIPLFDRAREIAKWSPKIKFLDEFPCYSRVKLENYCDKKP